MMFLIGCLCVSKIDPGRFIKQIVGGQEGQCMLGRAKKGGCLKGS